MSEEIIKKAILDKSFLPPLLIPDAINKSAIQISDLEIYIDPSTLENFLKFTTATPIDFVVGDIVEVRGVYSVTRSDKTNVILSVSGEYFIPNIIVERIEEQAGLGKIVFYVKNDLDVTGVLGQRDATSENIAFPSEIIQDLPNYFTQNPTLTSVPKVAKITSNFVVRYRIISEDKNRVSHWSPVYQVPSVSKNIGQKDVNVYSFNIDNNTANISWIATTTETQQYFDVYAGFGYGSLTGKLAIQSIVQYNSTRVKVTTLTQHNLKEGDILTISDGTTNIANKTVYSVLSNTEFLITDLLSTYSGLLSNRVLYFSTATENIYLGPNDGVSPLEYVATVTGNSASFKIPIDATRIKIVVQSQTIPRRLISANRVSETSIRSVKTLRRF